ncbi:MAG: hypothetical protein KC432_13080 [Thermomicrobiales bacterium]|nr:hypothetical protein [Thermomicrobiales bacterium]
MQAATTRRTVLRLAGGAALLACAGENPARPALAQEASPVATPAGGSGLLGKHVVVRLRTVKPGRSVDELLAMIQAEFVPLIKEVPGLIWYVAGANEDERLQFSVGVYQDAEGIAASNQRAGAWGEQGAANYVQGNPEIYTGVIGVAAEPDLAGGLMGKYLVVRLREPSPDWPVNKVMGLIDDGYVPLVREIPGFIAYFGSSDGEAGAQAYVGVFDDQAGADESTRIAGEWLTENDYAFFTGEPTVAEGVIGAAAAAAE